MDLKEAIADIRPAIVQIRVGDRSSSVVDGTGFFVSETCVATAWHVVKDGGPFLVGLAYENHSRGRANFTLVDADVEASWEEADLAILLLKENPFPDAEGRNELTHESFGQPPCAIAQMTGDRPDDGESITISGYPLEYGVLITTSGSIASSWAYENYGEFEPPGSGVKKRTFDIYVADTQANPGNSGGPTYRLTDGAVIGVCIQVEGAEIWDELGHLPELANAGLTLIRPTSYLLELMRGSGL
jgi:S1-C subfamily serine protease